MASSGDWRIPLNPPLGKGDLGMVLWERGTYSSLRDVYGANDTEKLQIDFLIATLSAYAARKKSIRHRHH